MKHLYPQYYKDVSDLDYIDVYMVHFLFAVNDPSGALQHASKKILLSGIRTGNKTKEHDIREARDALTRWLEIHDPSESFNRAACKNEVLNLVTAVAKVDLERSNEGHNTMEYVLQDDATGGKYRVTVVCLKGDTQITS